MFLINPFSSIQHLKLLNHLIRLSKASLSISARISKENYFPINPFCAQNLLFTSSRHMYIHKLVSHTTRYCCAWVTERIVQIDFERQIFEELLMAKLLYSQGIYQKSAERKSPKKYFFSLRNMVSRPISLPTTLPRLSLQNISTTISYVLTPDT